jgi:hypothetical protein
MTAEPVQYSLNSFKGECARSHSRGSLHGASQKTRRTGCDVLRLLILRLRVLRRWCRLRVLLCVLGIDWLISRLRGLGRRLWIAMAKQAA